MIVLAGEDWQRFAENKLLQQSVRILFAPAVKRKNTVGRADYFQQIKSCQKKLPPLPGAGVASRDV